MADKKFQKAAKAFLEDDEVFAWVCYCKTKDGGTMRAMKGQLGDIAFTIGIGIAEACMKTGASLDDVIKGVNEKNRKRGYWV